jgi:imidazolonepropionase-like amidohydrolase
MGVTLLLGTDAGSMGVEHGHAVFEEIDRYVEAGLDLAAVLRAATATARRHFGCPWPVLANGAGFDGLLLDASPFEDRASLKRPKAVWPA